MVRGVGGSLSHSRWVIQIVWLKSKCGFYFLMCLETLKWSKDSIVCHSLTICLALKMNHNFKLCYHVTCDSHVTNRIYVLLNYYHLLHITWTFWYNKSLHCLIIFIQRLFGKIKGGNLLKITQNQNKSSYIFSLPQLAQCVQLFHFRFASPIEKYRSNTPLSSKTFIGKNGSNQTNYKNYKKYKKNNGASSLSWRQRIFSNIKHY